MNNVNYHNSHTPFMTSTTIPNGPHTLPENYKSNISAADASKIVGGSVSKLGIRNKYTKSRNYLTNKYKKQMKHKRRITKHRKRQTRNTRKNRKTTRRARKIRRSHHYKGGYSQYMNNAPNIPTYAVAGLQPPSFNNALANPPPVSVMSNCTNCVDNYSRYTNTGFPSRGSY